MDSKILSRLKTLANPEHAKTALWFFKAGPGEYGEGDQFLGIRVPVIRQQVKAFKPVPLATCEKLLSSPFHEVRLFALLSMVELYQSKKPDLKSQVYESYMANRQYINNWDLVDSSSYKIVGPYLSDKSRKVLYQLATSENLWDRRIAIVTTYHFIKQNDFSDTLKLAEILLTDNHDLIHKAVGWMLKEIGKRDETTLINFLKPYYRVMPRTMLRTAIEKLDQDTRQSFLKGTMSIC